MLMKPTAMLYRNLMAMGVEECIRAYPLHRVVLPCGCDKSIPAQLMGAASANVPALMVPGGPMLRGVWRDKELGSGTDVCHFSSTFSGRTRVATSIPCAAATLVMTTAPFGSFPALRFDQNAGSE